MKITRADAVRAAMTTIRDEASAELVRAEAEMKSAFSALEVAAARLLIERSQQIRAAFDACGSGMDRLRVDLKLEATDDVLRSPPPWVEALIRDGNEWDCRVQLRTKVELPEDERRRWVASGIALRAAKARSLATSDLSDESRTKAVNGMLESTPAGKRVLEALAEFSRALRDASEDATL